MSVYIKGMEMPTSCEDCPMCHSNAEYDYAYCCVSSANTSGNKIPSDCPLIPVPEHGGREMKCIYSHEGGAYCDKHDHGAVTVGCCGEESCPDREVLTNADRIRAMSDEEMATFLFNNVSCSDCTMHGGGCSVDCEKWMLSWLKAPVEVNE